MQKKVKKEGKGQKSKAKNVPLDARGLPRLTDRQQAYVYERMRGKTHSDAYRTVYNYTGPHARQLAWRNEINPRVKAHIDHYLETIGRVECTKESYLHRLDDLGRGAEKQADYGNAIRAEVERGKAVGHAAPKRHEHVSLDLNALLDSIDGSSRGLPQVIDGEIVGANTTE